MKYLALPLVEGGGSGDDLDKLPGDDGLPRPVERDLQFVNHLTWTNIVLFQSFKYGRDPLGFIRQGSFGPKGRHTLKKHKKCFFSVSSLTATLSFQQDAFEYNIEIRN